MEKTRRVVITGIGAITPIGTRRRRTVGGAPAPAVRGGDRHPVRPVSVPLPYRRRGRRLSSDRSHRGAAGASGSTAFPPSASPRPGWRSRTPRSTLAREDRDRVGAMMGTALGGVARAEEEHGHFVTGGIRAVEPSLALSVFAGAASCNIAIEFGLSGPNSTNGMSCASGAMAIGDGFRAIMRGDADIMLAGGAEAPARPPLFRRLRHHPGDVHPQRRPRPRPVDRSIASATASSWPKGPWCWCWRSGGGRWRGAPGSMPSCAATAVTNDAHHMTQPRPDGRQAARAMTPGAARSAPEPE